MTPLLAFIAGFVTACGLSALILLVIWWILQRDGHDEDFTGEQTWQPSCKSVITTEQSVNARIARPK